MPTEVHESMQLNPNSEVYSPDKYNDGKNIKNKRSSDLNSGITSVRI
jgi:hypothetical protein